MAAAMRLVGLSAVVFAIIVQIRSDCRPSMDLVFVVDSSGSLGERNFVLVKQFIAKIVQDLEISLNAARVAVVRFSSLVTVISYLDQSTSSQVIADTITNMNYKGGGTNMSGALRVTREDVLTSGRGDRADVGDVVVVMTDGESWYPKRTAAEARLLRERDVEIIALGIGRGTSQRDLNAMTSGVVRVIEDINDLQSTVIDVRANVCTVAEKAAEKKQTYAASLSTSPQPATTPPPTTTTSLPPPTSVFKSSRPVTKLSPSATTASATTTPTTTTASSTTTVVLTTQSDMSKAVPFETTAQPLSSALSLLQPQTGTQAGNQRKEKEEANK